MVSTSLHDLEHSVSLLYFLSRLLLFCWVQLSRQRNSYSSWHYYYSSLLLLLLLPPPFSSSTPLFFFFFFFFAFLSAFSPSSSSSYSFQHCYSSFLLIYLPSDLFTFLILHNLPLFRLLHLPLFRLLHQLPLFLHLFT